MSLFDAELLTDIEQTMREYSAVIKEYGPDAENLKLLLVGVQMVLVGQRALMRAALDLDRRTSRTELSLYGTDDANEIAAVLAKTLDRMVEPQ